MIPSLRKPFSILAALCLTCLTVAGATALNRSKSGQKKEIITHTTMTTKKVEPPKIKKRVSKRKKKKPKNTREVLPLSPSLIPSIALDLQAPSMSPQADPLDFLEDTSDPTQPPLPFPSNPMPHYPFEARQAGIEGRVIVKVLVDEYGYSTQYKITHSNKHFDAEVLKVIGQWRFTPAKKGGMAVEKWVDIPFNFVL